MCIPHSLQCHFMQSHIHRVYACLDVTCHQRFWQNDEDLLRATAVLTRGWNRYRNKHRKLTLEKKNSPAAPAGTRTLGLSIDHESGVLPLSYPRSKCHTNGHCLCDSVPHSSWDSNCVAQYCCAMASGHCLWHSVVPAAVHGNPWSSGLAPVSSLHSFPFPLPPHVPVLLWTLRKTIPARTDERAIEGWTSLKIYMYL